jgi:hypothetical protein
MSRLPPDYLQADEKVTGDEPIAARSARLGTGTLE